MYTTEKLAVYAHAIGAKDLAGSVRDAAGRCILDLLGAACAGHESRSASTVRHMVRKTFSAGNSTIWFTGEKMAAPAAALANAAAASALDLDDGHRGAAGHPGASIIPAVFAVAEATDATGIQVLSALAVGYEIACRVSAARDFSRLPTLSTGRWCAYGAAAATAVLHQLQAPVLAQALAIAGSLVPDLAASGYSGVMGNHVKEGIPWSTMLGIMAVDLAQEGFTGPLDILDHPDYFDSGRIMAGCDAPMAIEQVYFKPYSCCRWSHAAIDGLLAVFQEHAIRPDDVVRITVETFERALRLNNYPDPESLESAQYSIPFCLAVAALKGPAALLPLSESLLHDADVIDFAGRVTLSVEKDLDALFPGRAPARVRVEIWKQIFEKTVLDPLGDPVNPMSLRELETKFSCLTRKYLSEQKQNTVMQTIREMNFDDTPFRSMPWNDGYTIYHN
jgi:2-methylcitrate dehydratase PrpD